MDFDIAGIIQRLAVAAIPILIAITFHEVSHGYVAYRLGDPTAKMMGRLTLNPLAHIDLFGTIIMPLLLFVATSGQFTFGYAKPVPVDARYFKNPKRDMAISAGCGPLANLALAVVSSLIFSYVIPLLAVFSSETVIATVLKPLMMIFQYSLVVNVIFAVFNMIPLPPLDGGRVLMGLLPYRYAYYLQKVEPYGFLIIMVLVMTRATSVIIYPVVELLIRIIRFI